MTTDEMKANIQNGIAWLEENNDNDWRQIIRAAIESGDFDMGKCHRCVFGHIEGDYYEALEVLDMSDTEARELGFALDPNDFIPAIGIKFDYDGYVNLYKEEYAKLTQLWIEALS